MAEVLSAYENAKSCIEVAQQIYAILQKIKDAPKERQDWLDEVTVVLRSLDFLKTRLDGARRGNSWSRGIQALVEPAKRFVPDKSTDEDDAPKKSVLDRWGSKIGIEKKPEVKGTYYYDTDSYADGGLLQRLRKLLEDLAKSLAPKTGIREVGTRLAWYWSDPGVKSTVETIVRLRSHIDSLLQQDQFDLSMATQIQGKDTNERIKSVQETQEHEARERERREILAWLSPLESFKRQDAVFTDSFPTGQWLFDSQEFKVWVRGRPWTLWCYGDPGAGKTVLCSNVIHHLEETFPVRSTLVLYLYLDYKEKEKQSVINLIGSLVKQLIQHQQFAFRSKELRKMFLDSRGEAKPSEEDMIRVLQEEFKAFTRVYLIIDGWNDAAEDVQQRLDDLLMDSLRADNVSTMVTSRSAEIDTAASAVTCSNCGKSPLSIYWHCNRCDLYDLCEDCKYAGYSCGNEGHELGETEYDRVHILVKATDDEIRSFVEWEMGRQTKHDSHRRIDKRTGTTSLSSTPLARRLDSKPTLKLQIPNEIVGKSKGMYLLARLYIDSLKTMQSVKQIEAALLNLPEDLDAVYEEKMKRITTQKPKRNAERAKEALYWIICTNRPLSFKELQHALSVEEGNTTYDPDDETEVADIISLTAGLVTIDSDQRAVRIHTTLHTYLQEHREKWFPGADTDIALTLLTYLNFDDLEEPCENDSGPQIKSRLEELPLLSYASQFWGDHIAKVCSESDVLSLLLAFVSNTGKLASCVQAAYFIDSKINADIDVRKGVNGLHVSALFGLDPVISELVLEKGLPIDSVDPKYEQTALMYACRKGHITTVTKLLDLGASVNVRSARESTAFFEAYLRVGEVYGQIAKLLLEKPELDINAAFLEEMNRTGLMMAASFGDEELVEAFLQRMDLDTNLQDQEGCTALYLAALNDNVDVVKLLLAHQGVNIDLCNSVGSSPLTVAARHGCVDIVDLLLAEGADISIKDQEGGGTPFLRAIDEGRIHMVETFLAHNVDIRTVDDRGRGLLHSASVNGHEDIVRLLLKAGLSKDSIGDRGETPLHDASRGGHYAVVQLLLEEGADREIKDRSGRVPATVAWQNGHIKVMRELEGKDTSAGTPEDEPVPDPELLPTWSLANLGLINIVRQRITILGKTSSTQAKEPSSLNLSDQNPDNGDNALHCAVTCKYHDILALLLEANVSPDSLNILKRAPLHLAAYNDDTESVIILLRHDPRQDLRDAWNMTPLIIAQNLQHYYLAVTLIEAGAQIDKALHMHIQPTFFAAVELGNSQVAGDLIAKGADHLHPDVKTGRTAKQIARANDDVAMLRTLDRNKSNYFAFRPPSQRSEDYASATSSPSPSATPPISPLISPPLVTSPPITPALKAGLGFSDAVIRPRPPVTG
ncbi:MAG: hypothetical protein M1827_006665 [Pycnora praestabilis]|nr:MAG: hypothetical protein M1827_006665 [Pycnora praestabilis]